MLPVGNYYRKSNHWLMLGGIIIIVVCSIPLCLQWNYIQIDDTEFQPKIWSNETWNSFKFSLICSCSISFPLIFDHFHTMATKWSNLLNLRTPINIAMIGVLLIPNIICLFYAIPNTYSSLVEFFINIRLIICIYVIKLYLQHYISTKYSRILSKAVFCLISTSRTFAYYSAFCTSKINQIILYSLEIFLHIFGIIMLGFLVRHWFVQIQNMSERKNLSQNQYHACIYIISLVVIITVITLLIFAYPSYQWEVHDEVYLAVHVLVYAVPFLLMSIFNSRSVYLEMSLCQQTIDLKKMFLRYMSHEMRTPLNSAIMGLQVFRLRLLDISNDAENIQLFDDIMRSFDIAVNILDNMLTSDHLETQALVLNKSEFHIWDFLNETVRPFVLHAHSHGIELSVIAPESLWNISSVVINADKHKISQVIRNLISNSVKFTNAGGVIKVHAHFVVNGINSNDYGNGYDINDNDEQMIQIDVIDTGCGITEEQLPRIFDNCLHFAPGTLQKGSGAGLGLSIAKGIVNAHEGELSLHSEGEGKGCIFTIKLHAKLKRRESEIEAAARLGNHSGDQRSPRSFSLMAIHSQMIVQAKRLSTFKIKPFVDQQHQQPPPHLHHAKSRSGSGLVVTGSDGNSPSSKTNSVRAGSITNKVVGTTSSTTTNNNNESVIIKTRLKRSFQSGNSSNSNTEGIIITSDEHNQSHDLHAQPYPQTTTLPTVPHLLPEVLGVSTRDLPPTVIPLRGRGSQAGNFKVSARVSISDCASSKSSTEGDSKDDAIKGDLLRRPSLLLMGHTLTSTAFSSSPTPQFRKSFNNALSNALSSSNNNNSSQQGTRRSSTQNISSVPPGDMDEDPQGSACLSGVDIGQDVVALELVRKPRILVVDDVPMNRSMLCRLLRDRCAFTDEAEDGLEALKKVEAAMETGQNYDIITMDYQMPVMDGPTSVKFIRELGFKGIILGVTGNALPIDVENFIAHGANAILLKPLRISAFDDAVRTLTGGGIGANRTHSFSI